MTFQEKLKALLNFGITEILPLAVKNPETQAKVTPWIGIGLGAIGLIEALFMNKTQTTVTTHTAPVVNAAAPASPPTSSV